MSDFILPGDIERAAQEIAQYIADAWDRLTEICFIKQYPISYARSDVDMLIGIGYTEIEAIHRVYQKVAMT